MVGGRIGQIKLSCHGIANQYRTLTRSACARATSAAFKPRISTVTKSWEEVFMSRPMGTSGRQAKRL